MRIAKVIARAGLCSRREAEDLIAQGRVKVNGKLLESPALNVDSKAVIHVDGEKLTLEHQTRLWRYYKPKGLITTHKDEKNRATVFQRLPKDLPRVISVGRLDYNSEGLLLLTTDGTLARYLELPSTGWVRRYKVRVHGRPTQEKLDTLSQGIQVEGIQYGPIEATLEKQQGENAWLSIRLSEGKNREIRKVMDALGYTVNRLLRLSYGPFQLGHLKEGGVEEVSPKILKEQLPKTLVDQLDLP